MRTGLFQSGRMVRFASVMAGLGLLGVTLVSSFAEARSLSDLVRKRPQLFLPSRMIPKEKAVFTLKAKPGQHYRIILSSQSQGETTPAGAVLRVGKPSAQEEGVIPASGVAQVPMELPDDIAYEVDRQYVDAVIWSAEDAKDAELPAIMAPSGVETEQNVVAVTDAPDPGSTMLIPGDPSMGGLMRSINMLNDVSGNARKRGLIDDGKINRKRQIDQTLNLQK